MARRRRLQRAGRGLPQRAAGVLLAAAAALCGCGAGPSSTLVLVTITSVPEGTRMLRATSYLQGQREQDPPDLDGRQRELVVRLPPTAAGLYRLEVEALGDDGCSFARGQAERFLGSERRFELSIAIGLPDLTVCTLTVHKAGVGQGYVESMPVGIRCGSRDGGEVQDCAARFQQGVPVRLLPRPSTRATFEGWTDDCIGFGDCEVIMTGPRAVTASFGVRPQ
jgi:hypothetical protein